jgi:lipopolysaccharide transport system permease protein
MSENPQVNVPAHSVAAEEGWTSLITPRQGWFDWRLNQLWRYRDLISLFVWRDFVSVYKQTVLGPLWHVIQPLLTTLMFTLMFGKIAGLPTDHVPSFLFYLSGNVMWAYFANNINKTSTTFVTNSSLLGKVYFHRMVIPVSIVISNLIAFAIQFGIFLIFLAIYFYKGYRDTHILHVQSAAANLHLTGWIFCAPLLLLMLAGYGLGGGIIVSALTTRYRDLANLVTFGVQLLMFSTTVIIPLSSAGKYRWVLESNPLTPIIEGFRYGFLGTCDATKVPVTALQVVTSFGIMVVVLAIGMMLFTHVEKTFMDTV